MLINAFMHSRLQIGCQHLFQFTSVLHMRVQGLTRPNQQEQSSQQPIQYLCCLGADPVQPIGAKQLNNPSNVCVQALTLSDQYKQGKLLAYQMLCMSTLRRHDLDLTNEHLLRFYSALLHGLLHRDSVRSLLLALFTSRGHERSAKILYLVLSQLGLDLVQGN